MILRRQFCLEKKSREEVPVCIKLVYVNMCSLQIYLRENRYLHVKRNLGTVVQSIKLKALVKRTNWLCVLGL